MGYLPTLTTAKINMECENKPILLKRLNGLSTDPHYGKNIEENSRGSTRATEQKNEIFENSMK